jgi:quinol monooxygenase YgiN
MFGIAPGKIEMMPTQPITVTARLKVKAGLEPEVKKELMALVPLSRADAGCLGYDLYQSAEDPAGFLFYENWQSREHLDAHLQTPHLRSFLARVNQWVAEPVEIAIWNKLS